MSPTGSISDPLEGHDEDDDVLEALENEEEPTRADRIDELVGVVDEVQGDLQGMIDELRTANASLSPGSRHVAIAVTHLEEAMIRLQYSIDNPDVFI